MVKKGELTARELEDYLQSVVTTTKKHYVKIFVTEKNVSSSVKLSGESGNVTFDEEYFRATV